MGVTRAIYPGSFDPLTLGHLDVIERARAMFPDLIVAIASNEPKGPLFTAAERAALIREALPANSTVRVEVFDGLLVEFARQQETFVVIRGLRAISDFEFEFQMALMNRRLEPRLETVFLTPQEEFTFLSSRIVKEVARLGGDVTPFVPTHVTAALRNKFGKT
ncbi:MAG: pantetheine-phosphate adenylyltransferase [Terrimicrobiaceae bacterium]|nr:pantetheine-phosphate adenylyltransferase [Terrimicrobiaceae bacterium]